MNEEHTFERALQDINRLGVSVLHHVHRFPVYGQDIVSSNMMVCICHSGTARAFYDLQEVCFRPNEVAIMLPYHVVHPIESSSDYDVTIILHSAAFVKELTQSRITHNRNKFHHQPACLLTDRELEQYMKAVEVLDIISQASVSQYPNRHQMLIAQTNILAEMLDACRRKIDTLPPTHNRSNVVFDKLCGLLATHFREQHEVSFYASQLHLSPRYLSILIKSLIGISASDYIEEYILIQAKNILSTRPDLSVQEISFYLGYSESPAFCRFFRRKTGTTPSKWRMDN